MDVEAKAALLRKLQRGRTGSSDEAAILRIFLETRGPALTELDFMKVATKDAPVRDFAAPPGIVSALVDPKTGRLTTPDAEEAKNEPFISGTEPTELMEGETTQPGTIPWPDYE